MPDTPTPTPALTDEQIETVLNNLGRISYMPQVFSVVEARAKREERERISREGVLHVWGFLSDADHLVSDVSVALCPGELHEVANHVIEDARSRGYNVSTQTVRSLDGYLREVHAVWAVDPDLPMWHRFVRPSAPWVKEATPAPIPPTSEEQCETCGRILSCVGTCSKGCAQ